MFELHLTFWHLLATIGLVLLACIHDRLSNIVAQLKIMNQGK